MSSILKNSLILLFFRLPLILIIISLFLGLSLGNVGLIFLCFGLVAVMPFITYLVQILFAGLKKVPYSDILLFAHDESYDATDVNVTPSYWITLVVFFFVYLIINAGLLLNLTKTDSTSSSAKKEKENNRKLRMKVVLVFTCLTLLSLLAIRWRSKTETEFGMFIGIILGGVISTAFYYAVKGVIGVEVLDVFGVENQMIEIKDFSKPYMCTA